MFDRFRRHFPADRRLEATRETAQQWDRIVRAEKAISTLRTTVGTTASAATSAAKLTARAAGKLAGFERHDTDPTPTEAIPASVRDRELPERQATRAAHEWSGPAALVVGPTSATYQVGQPLHRRRFRSDLVTGWPDGWLRISPVEVMWHPTDRERRPGEGRRGDPRSTMRVVRLGAADIADLELVDLGRRRAGLTVTAVDGNELWLYLDDRRKVDEMASRLRYGDRS